MLKTRGESAVVDVEESSTCVIYERLSIDNMLAKYVGDFGWAQLVHFAVVSLAWCLEGLHTMVMIFSDREPEWQCRPTASATFDSSGEYESSTCAALHLHLDCFREGARL